MAALPAVAAPLAYIPVMQPAGVEVIDLETNSVIATIPLTNNPSQLAITPDGKFVYVVQRSTTTGGFANTVAVIATATNTVAGSIAVGLEPEAVAISPNGQFMYVANTNWNSVWAIATSTNSVVATIPVGAGPTGLAFSPDGSFLYVANISGNSVSVIETSSNTVLATMTVGAGAGDLAISPDGAFLYTADYANGGVSVVNTASRTVVTTVKTAVNLYGIAVTPDGKAVYIVSGTDAAGYNASVIDTATNTIKTNIPLHASAVYGQVAISPDGAYVYVSYAGTNIIVIATATNTIVNTVPSGKSCGALVFVPTPAQEAALSSVIVNPVAIPGGTPATGTITLDAAAPSSGAVISLSSSDPSVILPASVTVAADNKSLNFAINTQPVAYPIQVALTAAWKSVSKTATVSVVPAGSIRVSTVSVNPASVIGGSSTTGTVVLTAAAPSGGITVSLWTNGAAAFVPSGLTIPQGATSGNFSVTTLYTAATAYDTITAFYNGTSRGTVLTINPVLALVSLRLNTPLTGGTSAAGTITLNAPAPSGGVTVDVWTDGSPAFVPASVTIPAGFQIGTFTVTTIYTSTNVERTVTAFYNGSMTTARLTVSPVVGVASVSVTPATVAGGAAAVGTVTLTAPAPTGGIAVELWTGGFPALVPVRIAIQAGQTSAMFPITTVQPFAAVGITITAFYSGSSQASMLTVTP